MRRIAIVRHIENASKLEVSEAFYRSGSEWCCRSAPATVRYQLREDWGHLRLRMKYGRRTCIRAGIPAGNRAGTRAGHRAIASSHILAAQTGDARQEGEKRVPTRPWARQRGELQRKAAAV